MKYTFSCLLIFLLGSCNNESQNNVAHNPDTLLTDSVKPDSVVLDSAKLTKPSKNDTINISTISTDTLYESKHDLEKILKYYPEFKSEYTQTPDIAYATRGDNRQASGDDYSFGSEAGQDSYYIVYAYFLKQKIGYKDDIRRETLVKIYRDINHIYMSLRGGGTYFGHMYKRILGYAEYSIYAYNYEKENKDLKTYKISAQKKLYIELLKQYIVDEITNNIEIDRDRKITLKKELFETVNHLNGLITDEFYLNQAQEFQHYNY
ncbi:MAG: hypothetical protein EOP54_17985 [Sphingobacteriales bacterium]|nr:MAG: hypothetical protein EOP54_17985 [Sphingobacteriales bacterium]